MEASKIRHGDDSRACTERDGFVLAPRIDRQRASRIGLAKVMAHLKSAFGRTLNGCLSSVPGGLHPTKRDCNRPRLAVEIHFCKSDSVRNRPFVVDSVALCCGYYERGSRSPGLCLFLVGPITLNSGSIWLTLVHIWSVGERLGGKTPDSGIDRGGYNPSFPDVLSLAVAAILR
jgi:hypothetical protein